MMKITRNINPFFLSITLIFVLFCNCNNDNTQHRKDLKGDWAVMGGQWPPGVRITEDSVIPMYDTYKRSNSLAPLHQNLGQPYRLTEEDSLIFGPSIDTSLWGLNKQLRGAWKIIKLTPDSLIVEETLGLKRFYKIK